MDEQIYLHIGNGGVIFRVSNDHGPTIHVDALHFGNVTNGIKLHVTKESLRQVAEMFLNAYEHGEFSNEYVLAARYEEKEKARCVPFRSPDGSKDMIRDQYCDSED
ncbi:hypothetical protein [Alicyclobacillus suci]|uniref:hypothetical protein n=1 Tax=Alicyclobacillus suci TaxID=2816080 RepID=UPI001A8FFD5D|nr:hypothetical protein [Alicyclobacillus suci]